MFTIADYKSAIAEKVKDLDIGVLCLNAGYVYTGPYMLLNDNEVERHTTTNILHVAYTCKALIDQMDSRFDKTG